MEQLKNLTKMEYAGIFAGLIGFAGVAFFTLSNPLGWAALAIGLAGSGVEIFSAIKRDKIILSSNPEPAPKAAAVSRQTARSAEPALEKHKQFQFENHLANKPDGYWQEQTGRAPSVMRK